MLPVSLDFADVDLPQRGCCFLPKLIIRQDRLQGMVHLRDIDPDIPGITLEGASSAQIMVRGADTLT